MRRNMICRMWHGRTLKAKAKAKADAYASFLESRAIPDYRSIPGNVSAAVLRRDEAEVAHFITVTWWESEQAIRAFAGEDMLRAKYYPEDKDYLLEFEPFVQHFEVVASGGVV